MKTTEEIVTLAQGFGFEHCGALNTAALDFNPAVREMCASGRCNAYGKRWSCPPACGTLDEIAQKASQYHRGVLLQSTAQMEDDFDVDTMLGTEQLHKQRFAQFTAALRREYPDCLPMGSGACTRCESCTYPDAPCRFPESMAPSMEAYGLLVSAVCTASGMKYNYGRQTITYTSCVLIDGE